MSRTRDGSGAAEGFALIGSAAFTAAGQIRFAYSPTLGATIVSGDTDKDANAEFHITILAM